MIHQWTWSRSSVLIVTVVILLPVRLGSCFCGRCHGRSSSPVSVVHGRCCGHSPSVVVAVVVAVVIAVVAPSDVAGFSDLIFQTAESRLLPPTSASFLPGSCFFLRAPPCFPFFPFFLFHNLAELENENELASPRSAARSCFCPSFPSSTGAQLTAQAPLTPS